MTNYIRILVLRPGTNAPTEKRILNELAPMKAELDGGFLEALHLSNTVDLWCDEEGKLKRLPPNRYLEEIHDIVCGPMVFTGPPDEDGDTTSLSATDIELLTERFRQPDLVLASLGLASFPEVH